MSIEKTISRKYTYHLNAPLLAFTDQVTDELRMLAAGAISAEAVFNLRHILAELIGNVRKHAQETVAQFEIALAPGYLLIQRIDEGKPFELPGYGEPPYADHIHQKVVSIYSDSLSRVSAKVLDEHTLLFAAEDLNVTRDDEKACLLEHFGLLLISKSAENFWYKFDPESGTNRFFVQLSIGRY